jgi:hypothetical protein
MTEYVELARAESERGEVAARAPHDAGVNAPRSSSCR